MKNNNIIIKIVKRTTNERAIPFSFSFTSTHLFLFFALWPSKQLGHQLHSFLVTPQSTEALCTRMVTPMSLSSNKQFHLQLNMAQLSSAMTPTYLFYSYILQVQLRFQFKWSLNQKKRKKRENLGHFEDFRNVGV
jgi:hypothetical protein